MKKIVCLGDNCVDFYDETGEAFFGGNPVNVAVYLSRLGRKASYIGAVGTDDFGRQLLDAVSEKGVDVSHVQVLEGKTALTHVTVRDGDRIFGDYDEGVMEDFKLREEDMAFILSHAAAVTGLWGHCGGNLEQIRRAGVLNVFDCADRPEDEAAAAAIPHSDIIFYSDSADEEEKVRQRLIRLNHMQGHGITVATRGAKGSLAYDGIDFFSCGIIECKVEDTMGAGDSFIAGFLDAYLKGGMIQECMKAGAECSAVTLGYSGAW